MSKIARTEERALRKSHPEFEDSSSFTGAAARQMDRLVDDIERLNRERNEALNEVARAHHEVLYRLSVAADMKDDDTGVHIIRLGFLSEALALRLGHTPSKARMLRKAAPMHDIGKIATPDHVLKKPGPLNPQEREIMNQHAVQGAEILGQSRIPLFKMAAELALTHHERWDGNGYPYKLAGPDIPISGRMVAVVDFFDALTMDRCYRPALTYDMALRMLAEQSGKAFDPAIVDVFLAHGDDFIVLREKVNRTKPSFQDLVQAP